MSFSKYLRRNVYKWHRITGLIVALPVMLWTISGFLHPVMNSRKPQVNNQALPPAVIDPAKVSVPLHKALAQNSIAQIRGFRIVKLDAAFYYQVSQPGVDTLTYINCSSGSVLPQGDGNYAAYLAQRFLSEKIKKPNQNGRHQHGSQASVLPFLLPGTQKKYPEVASIKAASFLSGFDEEYKASNKLLPVHRVSFERADGIRLYIDTRGDRLALAMDDSKALFTHFFAFAHSWSFLNGLGKWKFMLLGSFSLLCFASGIMGFCVYNITNKKWKRPAGNPTVKTAHRLLGNVFLTTTLLFAFSGAWHSFQKLAPKAQPQVYEAKPLFPAAAVTADVRQICTKLDKEEQLNDLSIVQMNGRNYWQLTVTNKAGKQYRYLDVQTVQWLPNGDTEYGCYLACKLSGKPHRAIRHNRCLTAFNHEYSMMNKRLPVIEVGFDEGENYFVETGTGTLSAVTNRASRAERFSFANLHMHHYWEMWLGKERGISLRNTVLIISTLGLMLAALSGMAIYAKKRWKF